MSNTTTTKTPLNEEYRSPTVSGVLPTSGFVPAEIPTTVDTKKEEIPTVHLPSHLPLGSNTSSNVSGPQVPVPTFTTSTIGKTIAGAQVSVHTSDMLHPKPGSTTVDVSIPPEHNPIRLNKARDLIALFGELKTALQEDAGLSKDILIETLQKAEEFIHQASNNTYVDAETRRMLEDLKSLMSTSRALTENKNITDRLLNIQKEAEQAIEALKSPELDRATTETAKDIKEFVTNWRSLFYLITSSRDFRIFLLDSINIAKGIVYGYTGREEYSEKSVERKRLPELSEAEWDRFQSDVRRILELIAKESIYREGISRIFFLLDLFVQSMRKEPIAAGIHLAGVAAETEGLVACFSGRETLDHFKAHLRNLILLINKNEPLKLYLSELKTFVLKFRSEEETKSEQFRKESKMMAGRGRELMRDLSEEEDLKHFLQACDDVITNIKNDEFLEVLRKQAGIVQSELTFVDTQGQTQVDTQSILKLQSALLPVLVDALKFIPVPKIDVNDSEKEFWLDNVVLCSYDIIPQHIRFHIQSTSDVDVPTVELKSHTYLVIELSNMRTEIKDVEFFFSKKTFPHFEEHGKATFRIKGQGAKLTFTFSLDQTPDDILPKITRGHASLDISDMAIDFDLSTLKHDILLPMITKMFKVIIEQQIEREVEKNLSGFVQKLGDLIMKSLHDINKPLLSGIEQAKTAVKQSPITQDINSRREKLE
jgi:hypothetical protein